MECLRGYEAQIVPEAVTVAVVVVVDWTNLVIVVGFVIVAAIAAVAMEEFAVESVDFVVELVVFVVTAVVVVAVNFVVVAAAAVVVVAAAAVSSLDH